MEPFTTLTALAAPIDITNCDTDRILPARFLRKHRAPGYERYLFHDMRFDAEGNERAEFVLNQTPFRAARILVAGANYGCGSSREGAVFVMFDYGIRSVIAPSFGDIHYGNALQNGFLPVVLPEDVCTRLRGQLHASPGARITIDLPQQQVTGPDGTIHRFDIDPAAKERLVKGLDDVGLVLQHIERIEGFEDKYSEAHPMARVIDMRLRPPLPSWIGTAQFTEGSGYYATRHGFPAALGGARSMPLLLEEMDAAQIRWGVIMGRQSAPPHGSVPNDEIREAVRLHPGRFVALAGIDLQDIDAAIAEVERTAAWPGFRGVSIEPGAAHAPMYADDRRLYPLYDLCQQRGLPLSITLSGFLSSMCGHDVAYGSPVPVSKVARDFPRLSIIVSHAAWPSVMEMLGVAFFHANVYVSPDLYMNHVDQPGAAEYLKAARFYLGDRLLFGTAYPSRPLPESVRSFLQWQIEPDLLDRILYRNAARVLGIEG